MNKPADIRVLACKVLVAVDNGRSLNDALPHFTPENYPHKARLQALVYGVLRHVEQLDFFASQQLKKPFKAKDADVYWMMMVGLYQLWKMRIKPHAVVNETVGAIAKNSFRKSWAKGVLNAVLRGFHREQTSLEAQLKHAGPAIQADLPDWLFDMCADAYDVPTAIEIGRTAQAHPPMTLRVNSQHCSPEDWLKQSGFEGALCTQSQTGVRLTQPVDVSELPGFKTGVVSVQDEAAQLCAQILPLTSGMRVLDACAAPGGKTLSMLEHVDRLQMTALDIDDKRLVQVKENLQRTKLDATLIAADGRDNGWWDEKLFDAILLDAPCSATGIIRRHPDIKLLRQPHDILTLVETQSQLLQTLWQCLKVDGYLLYATCSVLPQENAQQIEDFLQSTPDARLAVIDASWGHDTGFGRQILPGQDEMDGFFYALLRKVAL